MARGHGILLCAVGTEAPKVLNTFFGTTGILNTACEPHPLAAMTDSHAISGEQKSSVELSPEIVMRGFDASGNLGRVSGDTLT